MKPYLLFSVVIILSLQARSQNTPWQQLQYTFEVKLHTADQRLEGKMQLIYKNTSPDTLTFIWLLMPPRAYGAHFSAYIEEELSMGNKVPYFAGAENSASIRHLDFKVNGMAATLTQHPNYIELAALQLPEKLLPGSEIKITTPFEVYLTKYRSTLSYFNNQYTIANWHPRPVVYDAKGWALHPFTERKQYSEIAGDYRLHITVPKYLYVSRIDSAELAREDIAVMRKYIPAFVYIPAETPAAQKRQYLNMQEKQQSKPYKQHALARHVGKLEDGEKIDSSDQQIYFQLDSITSFNWYAVQKPLRYKIPLPNKINSLYNNFHPGRTFRRDSLWKLNPQPHFAIWPMVGYNHYDKLMLGVVLENKFTTKPFRYLFLPLYALGSKHLNGVADFKYYVPGSANQQQWIAGMQYASFTTGANHLADKQFQYRTQRLMPEISYKTALRHKDQILATTVRFRPYFFREENYSSLRQIIGNDTSYSFQKIGTNRYLNQLQLKIENNRTLYPWSAELVPEHLQGIFKLGLTGKCHFNYNPYQGLSTRVFIGKMWQSDNAKQASQLYTNRRYAWNLSSATGAQDYTYSNYFIGRSEFDGLLAQQTALKDGGFKVSTPLLNDRLGSTDNWLTALNLVADIPYNLNPTSLLPIKIPLKLFVDIGTTATAWSGIKNNSGSRLYYDAGIQVSLLKSYLNIYIPLLYSQQFRDYYKSMYGEKVFWKTVTFSIQLDSKPLSELLTVKTK